MVQKYIRIYIDTVQITIKNNHHNPPPISNHLSP